MSKLTPKDSKIWRFVTRSVTPLGEPMPNVPGVVVSDQNRRDHLAEKLKLPYQAVLDLHGSTQDEAYTVLLRRLSSYKSMGYKTILVITGKGIGKEDGGVLQRLVPEWLMTASFSDVVISVSSANREHGGSGAFYVKL